MRDFLEVQRSFTSARSVPTLVGFPVSVYQSLDQTLMVSLSQILLIAMIVHISNPDEKYPKMKTTPL